MKKFVQMFLFKLWGVQWKFINCIVGETSLNDCLIYMAWVLKTLHSKIFT